MFRQDIFYKNLPSKILHYRKTHGIKNLAEQTFLKKIKTPYFVYTGTGSIDFDFLEKDFKLLKKLSKRQLQVFLYEPVSYYFKGKDYNLSFYSEFHSDCNYDDDLHVSELDSINYLGKKIGTVTLNHCDYRLPKFMAAKYPFINIQCRDIFLRQTAASWMPNDPKDIPVITKKFWCGNGRYTIHRHMIMCYLADKPGNYSWWFESDMNWDLEKSWIGHKIDLTYLKKNNRILNKNIFELDFSAKKIKVKKNNRLYIPQGNFSQPNITYKKTFDECFVCIINETRFAQPTGNFSEKTIDAINYRKPFILVAPPKTLEYLKKFGFKTFDKYWPEDYDQIENHTDRMVEIFRIINFINSKKLDDLNDIYRDMLDVLDHNRSILKSLPEKDIVINDTD